MALEVAMDEMAEKLGLDPVDFRDPERHPGRGPGSDRGAVRFSHRDLVRMSSRLGAERFGWGKGNPRPAE